MKKGKWAIMLACAMFASTAVLTACGVEDETQYEIANYQGQLEAGQTKSDYNKALFYRNDKKADGADPFVLDNTARDGYYYMYTTAGSFYSYRSKNLSDWEMVGNALDNLHYGANGTTSLARRLTSDALWAPEVVYDAEADNGEGAYYLFFSATPEKDDSVVSGGGAIACQPYYQPYVAVSKYPDRGFRFVDFKDANSCGQENLHTYNEQPGIEKDDGSGDYEDAFTDYFARYIFLEPGKYYEFCKAAGIDTSIRENDMGHYMGAIDPHPYEINGKKYMYWVVDCGNNGIFGMEMENWLKPKWETAKLLTKSRYYTVADYQKALNGETVDAVSYEDAGNVINEGMCMTEHKGKYYLTYSVNDYANNSYQVCQAVADSPLGEFRKLNAEEGAVLLSAGLQGSQDVSGTGHHSFVTVDGKMYIVYHRHNSAIVMGGARNPAVDEVTWITVKDKDGRDLDVLYANGPTSTVQPLIKGEYRNIAGEAQIKGTKDANYLTDGVLSLYTQHNPAFIANVKETVITKQTTFTLDFGSARTVRAVMVYNSKDASTIFKAVKRIEFVCEENGKQVVKFIKDLEFSKEYYKADDLYGNAYYVTPGSCVYAEFEELNVKSVRVTIDLPEGQKSVGISEIKVLGK